MTAYHADSKPFSDRGWQPAYDNIDILLTRSPPAKDPCLVTTGCVVVARGTPASILLIWGASTFVGAVARISSLVGSALARVALADLSILIRIEG
jgi:hypothetical protein